jgi:CRP/FNR family cyclic AMP-dependent transcriptional regulator
VLSTRYKEIPMRRNHPIDQHLTNVPLFSACSKTDLEKLSGLLTTLNIPAGETVTREGRLGTEFVVIVDGKAVVSISGSDIATLGPGDFFG